MKTESEYRITIKATDELIDVSCNIEEAIKEKFGNVIIEVDAEFMREDKLE